MLTEGTIRDWLGASRPLGDGAVLDREARLLWLHYGAQRLTLAALASEFGVTSERIRQIEARALRRLRHPAVSGLVVEGIDDYREPILLRIFGETFADAADYAAWRARRVEFTAAWLAKHRPAST